LGWVALSGWVLPDGGVATVGVPLPSDWHASASVASTSAATALRIMLR
jgi:hypothetical protein